MQKLLSSVRRAVDEYAMIESGDKIAVGVSGGKDSLALLAALAEMRRFYPKPYEVVAITLDMGFDGADFSSIDEFCQKINVEYRVVKTDIKEIVFDIRKEKNPCSLCAKMRRGALHDAAKEWGCNKVALGHHYDDVVETFFLSLLYEGRVGCFSPVTYLDRKDITIIRPLIYTHEGDIKGYVKQLLLPVIKSNCPADGNTKRQVVKDYIAEITKDDYDMKTRIYTAIQSSEIPGWSERKMIGRRPVKKEDKS